MMWIALAVLILAVVVWRLFSESPQEKYQRAGDKQRDQRMLGENLHH